MFRLPRRVDRGRRTLACCSRHRPRHCAERLRMRELEVFLRLSRLCGLTSVTTTELVYRDDVRVEYAPNIGVPVEIRAAFRI